MSPHCEVFLRMVYVNHQVEQLIKANMKDYIRTKTSQTLGLSSGINTQ